jgi:hypothetical protein
VEKALSIRRRICFENSKKKKKKELSKFENAAISCFPVLFFLPLFFFLPSTEKVEENISNSGGSHGRLGMRNSGFWKERKRKKTKPVFFSLAISPFHVHSPRVSQTIYHFSYIIIIIIIIYIFLKPASQPSSQRGICIN